MPSLVSAQSGHSPTILFWSAVSPLQCHASAWHDLASPGSSDSAVDVAWPVRPIDGRQLPKWQMSSNNYQCRPLTWQSNDRVGFAGLNNAASSLFHTADRRNIHPVPITGISPTFDRTFNSNCAKKKGTTYLLSMVFVRACGFAWPQRALWLPRMRTIYAPGHRFQVRSRDRCVLFLLNTYRLHLFARCAFNSPAVICFVEYGIPARRQTSWYARKAQWKGIPQVPTWANRRTFNPTSTLFPGVAPGDSQRTTRIPWIHPSAGDDCS